MVINKTKLKVALLENGKTMSGLADYIGISKSTLYRKLNGQSDFYREEMIKTKEYCQAENMDEIFFASKVS